MQALKDSIQVPDVVVFVAWENNNTVNIGIAKFSGLFSQNIGNCFFENSGCIF